MPQVYLGNIRPHQWAFNRDAVCQDYCAVWVRRFFKSKYDAKPKMTYCKENNLWYYNDFGLHHINIHNANGFFNSSLGCVILDSEDEFIKIFRPTLKLVPKEYRNQIPVFVIQLDYLDMKAQAIGGIDILNPNSKKAIQ